VCAVVCSVRVGVCVGGGWHNMKAEQGAEC
jgi:hypothetical protein